MNTAITEKVHIRISEIAALMLWNLGAIKVNISQPFRLVSGNYSPFYVNCRQVISDSVFMHLFTAFAHFTCESYNVSRNVIAGGETAGIPFAAYIAQSFSLPMIYVRKAKKDHGIASLIEGSFPENARILLVEDLITDAKSKLHFIETIQRSGGRIDDVLVLFDRQQGGREILASRGIRLLSLTDMATFMKVAEEAGFLAKSQMDSLRDYIQFPNLWQSKHNSNLPVGEN